MKFDKDDIGTIDMIIYEGMLFESEKSLMNYLDTCEAEYVTSNFLLTRGDHEQGLSRSDLVNCLHQEYDDPDDEEEAIDDMCCEYELEIDKLLDKYDISAKRVSGYGYAHVTYKLSGTYGNLKKFAKEYSPYLDLNNPGDALFDIEEESDIDITSGDEDLILHDFSID